MSSNTTTDLLQAIAIASLTCVGAMYLIYLSTIKWLDIRDFLIDLREYISSKAKSRTPKVKPLPLPQNQHNKLSNYEDKTQKNISINAEKKNINNIDVQNTSVQVPQINEMVLLGNLDNFSDGSSTLQLQVTDIDGNKHMTTLNQLRNQRIKPESNTVL